jgi:hypothetical protein
LLLTPLPVCADLILNGSFSSPVLPTNSYQVFTPSSSPGLPGWTVAAGTVDIDNANTFGSPFVAGGQWLDLNGNSPGTLTQSFATTQGQTYLLSFEYANNTAVTTGDATATVSVQGSNTLLTANIEHGSSTTSEMNYQLFQSTFVADSGTATLQFESTFPGTSGIALDAISVTAVPEPSSIVLLGIGAVALVSLRWTRRLLCHPV